MVRKVLMPIDRVVDTTGIGPFTVIVSFQDFEIFTAVLLGVTREDPLLGELTNNQWFDDEVDSLSVSFKVRAREPGHGDAFSIEWVISW